jgi:hypothetical protein
MVAAGVIDDYAQYKKAVERAAAAKTPAGRDSANEKAEKYMMKIVDALADVTGIPYANLRKMFKNLSAIPDSENPQEAILRLLNYGEYTINKGKAEKGESMSKSDMKKFFPELYEDVYGEGTPYYEAKKMKDELKKEKKEMMEEARR